MRGNKIKHLPGKRKYGWISSKPGREVTNKRMNKNNKMTTFPPPSLPSPTPPPPPPPLLTSDLTPHSPSPLPPPTPPQQLERKKEKNGRPFLAAFSPPISVVSPSFFIAVFVTGGMFPTFDPPWRLFPLQILPKCCLPIRTAFLSWLMIVGLLLQSLCKAESGWEFLFGVGNFKSKIKRRFFFFFSFFSPPPLFFFFSFSQGDLNS